LAKGPAKGRGVGVGVGSEFKVGASVTTGVRVIEGVEVTVGMLSLSLVFDFPLLQPVVAKQNNIRKRKSAIFFLIRISSKSMAIDIVDNHILPLFTFNKQYYEKLLI
jgi:hypothetical protein